MRENPRRKKITPIRSAVHHWLSLKARRVRERRIWLQAERTMQMPRMEPMNAMIVRGLNDDSADSQGQPGVIPEVFVISQIGKDVENAVNKKENADDLTD